MLTLCSPIFGVCPLIAWGIATEYFERTSEHLVSDISSGIFDIFYSFFSNKGGRLSKQLFRVLLYLVLNDFLCV